MLPPVVLVLLSTRMPIQGHTGNLRFRILFRISLCLVPAVFPLFASSQVILTGDFDGKLQYMNVRRTVPDSLNSKAFSFLGSAELDFEYSGSRWGSYVSLAAGMSKGTSLETVNVPASWYINLYEAWLRYSVTKDFSVQAGRIEIAYDDQRFFEARDWSNLVTAHNAVIFHYIRADSGLWNDVGFAANRFGRTPVIFSTNPVVNSYRYMSFWYFQKKLADDQVILTANNIFNADDSPENPSLLYGRNTAGGSAWLAWPSWDFTVSGFYQGGHITDGRQLSAWYLAGYFSWHPTEWLRLMPAFEHLSGDNIADSGEWRHTVHGFSLLYGNLDNRMGRSGLFYSLRTNIHPALNNIFFKATFNFSEKVSLEGVYHWITVPDHYAFHISSDSTKLVTEKLSSTLLQEGDLTLTWVPLKNLEITLYYSLIFPGPGMKTYNGWEFSAKNPVSYSYLEVDWTPVFWIGRHRKKPE
jgi:hypothetical protein